MTTSRYTWAVSAQPWPNSSAADLAREFSDMGFDGIEIPARDGFPVTPANVATELPRWSKVLADSGLRVTSVTGDPTPELFEVCAATEVPLIRVMAPIAGRNYTAGLTVLRDRIASWAELSASSGVRVAVQQHHGPFVSTSSGLSALLSALPAPWIGAAWDAAHSALAGEDADLALSQLDDRLALVNLRNAYYQQTAAGDKPSWEATWVGGSEGMSDWASVAAALTSFGYSGTLCLAAQYTSPQPDLSAAVRKDLAFAKGLFE
jgi:sugar phosphate isomerase/epimerase